MKKFILFFGLLFFINSVSAVYISDEFQKAYQFAYMKWITTITPIENANLNWSLTRIAMAKMVSKFAINVLWLTPDSSIDCTFSDVSSSLDAQYNNWVTQACQLWLMWIWDDWKKSQTFNPFWTVTRAQWWTSFSRVLSKLTWSMVQNWNPYYSTHLQYLQSNKIINSVSNPAPSSIEKRGNVMVMMYRAANRYLNWIDYDLWLGTSDNWNWGNETWWNTTTWWNSSSGWNGQNWSNTWWLIVDWVHTNYYENWAIKEKLTYKDWKLNWEYSEYYPNWLLKSKWTYKNWEKTWWWVEYYDNWTVKWKWDYVNWKKNWEWLEYHDNWKLSWKWTYTWWVPQNWFVYYDETWKVTYKKDDGTWGTWAVSGISWVVVSYYDNWTIKEQWAYDWNWNKIGEWITYFSDWKIRSQWVYNEGWFQEWKWFYYFDNWVIESQWSYNKYGLKEWKWDYYYESWNLKEEWEYNEYWNEEWLWTAFYEEEQKKSETHYSNWVLNWEQLLYYETWGVSDKSVYENWELHGQSYMYYVDWSIRAIRKHNEDWSTEIQWYYENWDPMDSEFLILK